MAFLLSAVFTVELGAASDALLLSEGRLHVSSFPYYVCYVSAPLSSLPYYARTPSTK
jgi:hypothetical protein